MSFFVKMLVGAVFLTLPMWATVALQSASEPMVPKSMSPESMKTAYIYLKWYVEKLQKDKLTETQKKQLENLKKQVDAGFSASEQAQAADTHQLWQKLGELERALDTIANALGVSPLPTVFSGVEPMSSTQLSVSASSSRKRLRPQIEREEEEEMKKKARGQEVHIAPPSGVNQPEPDRDLNED